MKAKEINLDSLEKAFDASANSPAQKTVHLLGDAYQLANILVLAASTFETKETEGFLYTLSHLKKLLDEASHQADIAYTDQALLTASKAAD